MFPFYTPWKYQKTFSFLIFSGGMNKKGTLGRHGLTKLYRPIKHPDIQRSQLQNEGNIGLKWLTLD